MDVQFIFSLAILLFSVVIHEVAHGYVALAFGDRTAEYQGRLTLNPIKHIDPVGTILFPLLTIATGGGFVFGWAKPVPYNPYNLRNRKLGEGLVALAGPLSNLAIALVFGLLVRYGIIANELAFIIVGVNLTLAVFNLVPVPPLDGSKVLSMVLPRGYTKFREQMERFGFFGVLIFLIFFWHFFSPVIPWLFSLITGL